MITFVTCRLVDLVDPHFRCIQSSAAAPEIRSTSQVDQTGRWVGLTVKVNSEVSVFLQTKITKHKYMFSSVKQFNPLYNKRIIFSSF
jgi:hypothetical protein